MQRKIFIFIFLAFLVVLQVSALPNFFPEKSVPSLALIIVIVWAAKMGFDKSWKTAAATGMLVDLFSFLPVGTNVLTYVAAAFLVSFLAKRFLVTQRALRFFVLAVLVLAGSALDGLLKIFLANVFSFIGRAEFLAPLSFDAGFIFKILYSVVLFGIVYWPIKKIEKFLNLYGTRLELKSDVK